MTAPYGFRLIGELYNRRRLVDWWAALRAYAAGDARAALDEPAYLSAYCYPDDFPGHLNATGTPKGYAGPAAAPFVWFDIDKGDDLDAALADARRLAGTLLERYRGCDDDGLLLAFSGAKGFHVGLPVGDVAGPAVATPTIVRRFAEAAARRAGIGIDPSIYDRVRPFRAPNSRHPKSGLYKRRLALDELLHLAADQIAELAREPMAFDLPAPAADAALLADWQAASEEAGRSAAARRRNGTPGRLQRETLNFIRDGADIIGTRHARLFRAAANLTEFGCPSALAHELLTPAALDSGLPPAEVRRQIDCGLTHVQGKGPTT
jgi:hypothetical protein